MGGLALFWKDPFDVSLLSYSTGHIDVAAIGLGREDTWFIIGFYGNPRTE